MWNCPSFLPNYLDCLLKSLLPTFLILAVLKIIKFSIPGIPYKTIFLLILYPLFRLVATILALNTINMQIDHIFYFQIILTLEHTSISSHHLGVS